MKFFEAFANVFRIPDLRRRVLFTLAMPSQIQSPEVSAFATAIFFILRDYGLTVLLLLIGVISYGFLSPHKDIEHIREGNTALDEGRILAGDAEGLKTALLKIDPVLDIFPKREENLDAEIEALIAARNAARKSRNFAESDRLRDELVSRGILLEDKPGGTRWRRK